MNKRRKRGRKTRPAFTFAVGMHAKPCWGVDRAIIGIQGWQQNLRKRENTGDGDSLPEILVIRPIVHNRLYADHLAKKGIRIIASIEEARGKPLAGNAHGNTPKELARAKNYASEFVDFTCPIVKDLHKSARALKAEGRRMVLIGLRSREHAEVIGTVGVLDGDVFVAESEADVERIPYASHEPIGVIAQTTFDREKIQRITDLITKRFANVKAAWTLCDDIDKKQEELRRRAPRYDTIIVVGDAQSANSSHLADIARELRKRTFFVLNADELSAADVKDAKRVFVAAGASTPPESIQDIVKKLQSFGGMPEASTAQ